MSEDPHRGLELLTSADPELADSVAACLAAKPRPVGPALMELLVSEVLWALGLEISFGRAVAAGFGELIGEVSQGAIETYQSHVRNAGESGPSQGRIMAECLPAVLKQGDQDLLVRFRKAWEVMAGKGTYLLGEPVRALVFLLMEGDTAAARVYLELLQETFAQALSYEECRYFGKALPKAARDLAPARRVWQLTEMLRVLRFDRRLVEPLQEGFQRGLGLLSQEALSNFISSVLRRYRRNPDLGRRHVALESRAGQERFGMLQVSIGLSQLQDRLQRYLHARTGLSLAIRPRSALKSSRPLPEAMVCSDGQAIYLPDEIGRFSRKQDNMLLYVLLVRLEASFHEFGTVDFDLEKVMERCRPFLEEPAAPGATGLDGGSYSPVIPGRSDLERFFAAFPDEALAADLFTLIELGRIRRRLNRCYPGMVRRFFPLLSREVIEDGDVEASGGFLGRLLARIVFAPPESVHVQVNQPADRDLSDLCAIIEAALFVDSPVESSAEAAARLYQRTQELCRKKGNRSRLATPFGWRPWPGLWSAGALPYAHLAERITSSLAQRGLKTYRTDVRRRLVATAGRLTLEDLLALCPGAPDLEAAHLQEILGLSSLESTGDSNAEPGSAPAFTYPEWDIAIGDYLQQHVRLYERVAVPGHRGFYLDVLSRRQGLIAEMRRAFEQMRPEGLRRLRRWPEGDEFDYRQLVDRIVDRRAGNMPGERLFIKRIKQQRDVAVLVLVDLSRSTANVAAGSGTTVLAIQKEAIVVLCEALTVVGDAFAIAGFSGSGRLGVDYFRIKGFAETMSDEIAGRIGALRAQHNTRMGAAIRHARRELEKVQAKTRLLLMLSDGFPNDAGYKHRYAVADTRKALLELTSHHIRFHAVTVSLPVDPQLDELYGRARHHVITDVRELPARLLRVYSALTRS